MPELRPYQAEGKAEIYDRMNHGHRYVLYVLPTGGGKSNLSSDIISDFNAQRSYTAVIAHRQELVSQMSKHLARAGVYHRLIAPKNVIAAIISEHRLEFGRSFINQDALASVIGVDTLIRRTDQLAQWAAQVRFWLMDEAHHVLPGNKWGAAVRMFPNAYGLGVTATPQRADGQGLDGIFQTMVLGPSMRQLIDAGWLSEYEIVVPESDFDVTNLRIPDSGDWTSKQLREAAEVSHIVGDVVEQYTLYAYGKRGITFASDVKTAMEIAERFNASGIPAQAVSAETDDGLRAEYIRRFRDGSILQLVNVDLFGEGFDVPAVEVVSKARPTASLAVYLQQFGRALRPLTGKTRGLIIDHVSNIKRHGLPDKARYWSLAPRDKRAKRKADPDEIPIKICLNCKHPYEASNRACPWCGYVPVPVGGGRSVEQVDGDLMLLDAALLAQMRAAVELETPEGLGARTGGGPLAQAGAMNRQRERIASQGDLRAAIAQWAGYETARGRSDEESYRRFYHGTGGIDVLTALSLPRVEMDKLRETVLGWIAGHAT